MTRTSPMIRGWQPAPAAPRPRRRMHRFAWLALLPLLGIFLWPHPAREDIRHFPLHAPAASAVPYQASALPKGITTTLPEGDLQTLAVPTRHLAQGKMLLIDESHPLPDDFIPADTLAILNYTQGRVACRDLTAVSGQETLDALTELFIAARNDRIIQLTVFTGTRSAEQQRLLQTDTLANLARDMSLEEALQRARMAIASPDCSEHQTPWAVDIRICPVWNGAPDSTAYAASEAGRWLAANCWRFGFIQRWPQAAPDDYSCRAWHLRYVGRAHAMLMHALNANFEEYLALLQEHGALILADEKNAPLAAAVCLQAGEHQTTFTLPQGQIDDLSLDNQGWAIASCLFTESDAAP